jgi:hypothetical protein
MVRAGQAPCQRAAQSAPPDRHDARFHGPAQLGQVIGQRCDGRLGEVVRQLGQQDDADAGVGQRIALEVAEERVVEFLGHSSSRQ